MNPVPTTVVLAVQDPPHPILSCYTDHMLDFGSLSNTTPLIKNTGIDDEAPK